MVALVVSLVASVHVASADVLNMGGTRDPVTGQWTGDASLQFVTVGDINNAADSTGYGSVGYTYQMGKYDVTAAQYCQFLNAVAATDTYGLYNTHMAPANNLPAVTGGAPTFGIVQSSSPGSYTYSVTGNRDFPMNMVTWGDAARFANWLTNGQPSGAQDASTTEDGSYTLNGATTATALNAVTRNANARYVIPTENEWYKAAYYGPTLNRGAGGYWLYPTQSNSTPSHVLSPTGTNNANFAVFNGYYFVYTDPTNYLTLVGAFAGSPSAYGTFDQGGDAWQWNEAVLYGSGRGLRGGSLGDFGSDVLKSSYRHIYDPTNEHTTIGFRVALVPEPMTLTLLALGGLLIARRQRA
jgi:formylglycine-generating enzyme required for sulfatase activity